MANIFKLVKLARTAYKAAPVVILIGMVVARYAKSKLESTAPLAPARRPSAATWTRAPGISAGVHAREAARLRRGIKREARPAMRRR